MIINRWRLVLVAMLGVCLGFFLGRYPSRDQIHMGHSSSGGLQRSDPTDTQISTPSVSLQAGGAEVESLFGPRSIDHQVLFTELQTIRDRLTELESSREAEASAPEIALDDMLVREERLTEEATLAVSERRVELDAQFEWGDPHDARSEEMNAGLQEAIATNGELRDIFVDAGCKSSLCRLEVNPGSDAISGLLQLMRAFPALSEMSAKTVFLRSEDRETIYYVRDEVYEGPSN